MNMEEPKETLLVKIEPNCDTSQNCVKSELPSQVGYIPTNFNNEQINGDMTSCKSEIVDSLSNEKTALNHSAMNVEYISYKEALMNIKSENEEFDTNYFVGKEIYIKKEEEDTEDTYEDVPQLYETNEFSSEENMQECSNTFDANENQGTVSTKKSPDDHRIQESTINKCKLCSFKTARKQNLDRHCNLVHNKQNFKITCEFCNKPFAEQKSLQEHLLKQHKMEIEGNLEHFITSKIHTCKICSYETTFLGYLTKHKKVHNEQSRKQCQFCDKSFAIQLTLDDHVVKKHKEELNLINSKIYKCDMCPYQSTYRHLLQKHFDAIHNEHRLKVNCQFCEKSFTKKSILDEHVIRKHEEEIKSDVTSFVARQIYSCNSCSYKTTSKNTLNMHINSVHSEQVIRNQKCQFCDKSFKVKRTLQDHLLKQHKEKIKDNIQDFITSDIYKCNLCGMETTQKSMLLKHINSHNKQTGSGQSQIFIGEEPNIKKEVEECDTTEYIQQVFESNDFTSADNVQKCSESLETNANRRTVAPKKSPDRLLQDKKKIYKCKLCSYQARIKYNFMKHLTNHNKPKLKCRLCNKTFTRRVSLDEHLLHVHRNEIKNNVKNFITSKIHTCQFCSYQSTINCMVKKHINSMHYNRRHICQFCDQSFALKYSLENHLLRRHRSEIKNDMNKFITGKIITCKICTFKTTRKNMLNRHIIAAHDKRKCHFCHKSFACKRSLENHMYRAHKSYINKSILPNKIFKCNLCAYESTVRGNLNSHIKKVHNPQRLKCQFCDRSFISQLSLDDHILKQHKDESSTIKSKMYMCNLCSYQSIHKPLLEKHVNSQHIDKKLNCQFCNVTFAKKLSLNDHLIKHHENEIQNNMDLISKIHVCNICNYKSTSRCIINRHMNAMHNEQKIKRKRNQFCQFCDKSFTQKRTLDDHLLKQHYNEIKGDLKLFITTKVHTCNMCDYVTIRADHHNSHIKSAHMKQT